MSVIITHPTGNEFFRAAAQGFYDAGILNSIYTSVASFSGTPLHALGSFKLFSDIKRRSLDNSFKSYTHTHPWKELGRQLASKAGNKNLIKHETGIFSVDAVYQYLDKHVSKKLAAEKRKGTSAIYAYEDGAYYTFKEAKESTIKCLYDLPIGYWRSMHKILSEEKELNPGWAVTLGGLNDSPTKLEKKDAEIGLADALFVASSFTAATLEIYPGQLPEVHVIPYGFPEPGDKKYQLFNTGRKIKILFVGGLSQRKGLSYLFKAVNGLEKYVSLTIVGRASNYDCEPLKANLKKHSWIESLAHNKVLEIMRAHDVLLFPSLFEGFGLVITEAMAQGTPVITTERTAGPDIIKHGENGWLVNAGSSEEIKNILEQIILRPEIIEAVGKQAMKTAEKRPWKLYGNELAEAIKTYTN